VFISSSFWINFPEGQVSYRFIIWVMGLSFQNVYRLLFVLASPETVSLMSDVSEIGLPSFSIVSLSLF
jgi:hypothetical protein